MDSRWHWDPVSPQHDHLPLGAHSHVCQAVPSKVLHPVDGASEPSNSWEHLGPFYPLSQRETFTLSQEEDWPQGGRKGARGVRRGGVGSGLEAAGRGNGFPGRRGSSPGLAGGSARQAAR